jgi:hypothetical protein
MSFRLFQIALVLTMIAGPGCGPKIKKHPNGVQLPSAIQGLQRHSSDEMPLRVLEVIAASMGGFSGQKSPRSHFLAEDVTLDLPSCSLTWSTESKVPSQVCVEGFVKEFKAQMAQSPSKSRAEMFLVASKILSQVPGSSPNRFDQKVHQYFSDFVHWYHKGLLVDFNQEGVYKIPAAPAPDRIELSRINPQQLRYLSPPQYGLGNPAQLKIPGNPKAVQTTVPLGPDSKPNSPVPKLVLKACYGAVSECIWNLSQATLNAGHFLSLPGPGGSRELIQFFEFKEQLNTQKQTEVVVYLPLLGSVSAKEDSPKHLAWEDYLSLKQQLTQLLQSVFIAWQIPTDSIKLQDSKFLEEFILEEGISMDSHTQLPRGVSSLPYFWDRELFREMLSTPEELRLVPVLKVTEPNPQMIYSHKAVPYLAYLDAQSSLIEVFQDNRNAPAGHPYQPLLRSELAKGQSTFQDSFQFHRKGSTDSKTRWIKTQTRNSKGVLTGVEYHLVAIDQQEP